MPFLSRQFINKELYQFLLSFSTETRTANVYANSAVTDVLCLYRKLEYYYQFYINFKYPRPFLELIGDLNEFKNKNYEDEKQLLSKSWYLNKLYIFLKTLFYSSKGSICSDSEPDKLVNVRLKDLELVCTLGVGGFGRVELVWF